MTLLSGTLADLDLETVAAATSLGRSSLRLELRSPGGELIGSLVLKAGRVVSASAGGVHGYPALRVLLSQASNTRFVLARETLDFALSSALASVDELGALAGEVTEVERRSPASNGRPSRAVRDERSNPVSPAAPRVPMMQGLLDEFDLLTLLQTIGVGRQLVEIDVRDRSGTSLGVVAVKSGKIVWARVGHTAGLEAVGKLLGLSSSFQFAAFRVAGDIDQVAELASVAEVSFRFARGTGELRMHRVVMEGELTEFDIATLLQTMACSRQYCALEILDAQATSGTILVKAGFVLSATCGRLSGVRAIRQLIAEHGHKRFRMLRLNADVPDQAPLGPVARILLALDSPAPATSAGSSEQSAAQRVPSGQSAAQRVPSGQSAAQRAPSGPSAAQRATSAQIAEDEPQESLEQTTPLLPAPLAAAPGPTLEPAPAAVRPEPVVMEGSLSDFDLRTLLEVLAATRQHVRLHVLESANSQIGEISLKAGWIMASQAGALHGKPALVFLLGVSQRMRFRVVTVGQGPGPQEPLGPIDALLSDIQVDRRPVRAASTSRSLRWAIPASFTVGGALIFLILRAGVGSRSSPTPDVSSVSVVGSPAPSAAPPAPPSAPPVPAPDPAAAVAAAPSAASPAPPGGPSAPAVSPGPAAVAPPPAPASPAAPSDGSSAPAAPSAATAPPAAAIGSTPPVSSADAPAPRAGPAAVSPTPPPAVPTPAPARVSTSIKNAQSALKRLGIDPGPIDNIYGRLTRAAILKFQRSQHLPATGFLDQETWSAIVAQLTEQ
jgi:hypothetical protein